LESLSTPPSKIFTAGMVASMLCWGISWPSAKVLSTYGSAEGIALLRFACTFISLVPIVLLMKEPVLVKRQGLSYIFLAGLCLSFYSFFFLKGIRVNKAGFGGVLVTTLNPMLAALITMLVSKKWITGRQWMGLGIGLVAGIILLRLWDNWQSMDVGVFWLLLATGIWALLSRFTSMSSHFGSPIAFSAWMYLLCTFLLAPFITWHELNQILVKGDFFFWLNLIFSSSITTAGATTFFFYATSKIGASAASNYMFMVPLSASLGAFMLLGETQAWNTIVGGFVGLLAVYILQKPSTQ
jgi:drug/metabolite transporter (DMT)-like permease